MTPPRILVDDSLGRWVIHQRTFELCSICHGMVPVVMRPHTHLSLPKGIEVRKTLLARGLTVGLTCGCYAKLHRQIAHIQDNMKRKDKRP